MEKAQFITYKCEMGRQTIRSRTIRRTRGNDVSINLVLFIVAISLFVLLRLTSIIAIVSYGVTGQHPDFFRPEWNFQPTTIEIFALAGVLLLVAQVIWVVQFLRNWSWPPALLGTINIMAAGGVIVYCLVCWSFYNPAHPVAKYVNSWGTVHQFMTTFDRITFPDR